MRISHAVTMWEEMVGDGVDPLHPTPQRVDIQGDVDHFSEDAAMIRLRETWIEACLNFDEFAAEQILGAGICAIPGAVGGHRGAAKGNGAGWGGLVSSRGQRTARTFYFRFGSAADECFDRGWPLSQL